MPELEYPSHLRYSADHEWVVAGSEESVYRVGVTAYAQDSLGEVVFVDVPAEGDALTAGEACGEIESTKSVSDLVAPLSGTVVVVNPALEDTPEVVNSSPYEDGWLYEVRASAPDELDQLMDADAYRESLS